MNNGRLHLGPTIDNSSTIRADLLKQLESIDLGNAKFPLSLCVSCDDIDPFHLLNANQHLLRFIWSDRDTAEVFSGIGEAVRHEVTSGEDVSRCVLRCQHTLNGNLDLKFFGGISFDGTDTWTSLGAGVFVVPRIAYTQGKLILAIMSPEDIDLARHDLERIRLDVRPFDSNLPSPTSVQCVPTEEGWQTRIDEALALIRSEAVEKIVLCRKTMFSFDQPLDPVLLSARLAATTHDCFVFCIHESDGPAFLGATPEQLFLRNENQLQSEVIAGTRVRGESETEDQRLANELLNSDKDQREHDIVRKSIRQKLHKFVDHLSVDNQASLLRLARKQHLRSNVQGILKPGVDDGMLLQRLHPTPAVGGYPTDNALPEIARIERFSRGWYAAPIGWIGADSAQFAVAIRSGFLEENTLTLFSGAGIVRGSTPEEEWHEVGSKIEDFLNIFRHDSK